MDQELYYKWYFIWLAFHLYLPTLNVWAIHTPLTPITRILSFALSYFVKIVDDLMIYTARFQVVRTAIYYLVSQVMCGKSQPIMQDITLSLNTFRPRENCRHFPDGNFKCIFLNEDLLILSKFVLINNISALAQIMAGRRPGASHYLNQWWLVYWRIYVPLELIELIDANCN